MKLEKNQPAKSSPVWGTLYDRFTPRFPVKILVIIGLLFCFFGNFLYVIQRKRLGLPKSKSYFMTHTAESSI